MTENEAIMWLREMQNPMISETELYCAEACYGSGKMVYPDPEDYVFETAIKALEEIQQYRAIGTVEECRTAVERMKPKKVRRFKKQDKVFYQCRNCGRDVFTREKYCAICGQAIDCSE